AGHLNVAHNIVGKGGITPDLLTHFVQQSDYFLARLAVSNSHAQRDLSPIARSIRHNLNCTVRYQMDGAVFIPEHSHPQAHSFDRSLNTRNTDDVADVVLIFQKNKEAVDEVVYQSLRTKTYRQPSDACAGKHRPQIQP